MRHKLSVLLHRPPGREAVIDGVRAIAILWVFVLHVVFFHYGTLPDEVGVIFNGTWTQWIRQGTLGVDLFFVISGYLIGTILLLELRKSRTIHLRRFYARRFLRLLPVYFVVMVLAAYFLQDIPVTATGGQWSPSGNVENAWANLLYVNNFITIGEQYMPWCWSLAIEEQFYLLAPLFLLFVVTRTRRPVKWMLAIFALSGLIRLALIQLYGFALPLTATPDMPEWALSFDMLYDKPYARYGGLLAGMVAAYASVFHGEAMKHWFASSSRSTLLALFSATVFGVIACTTLGSSFFETTPGLFNQIVHSHHRDLFALSALALILVALHGQGIIARILQRGLSMKVLYPVAQLSYSIYLVHEVVMLWVFPKTAPFLLNEWGLGAYSVLFLNGALSIVLTLVISGLLFVFVESPSMEFRKSPAFKRFAADPASAPRGLTPSPEEN